MPDFSYAYNNQTLSPNPAYPFAGLDPVLFTFNRYDVFTWAAGLRQAIGQLLVTDSGWVAGTRVAIVFADNTVLYDTVATIAEAGGDTDLTFTTYNSEVTGSITIINLDYVGYRLHLRINGTRLIGATVVPFTVEAYAPFSAAGYASVDVAALLRDRLNTTPERLYSPNFNPTYNPAALYQEGPMVQEVVTCEIDYRVECTTYTGSYGWNSLAGDTAACKFYHAAEAKGMAEGPDNLLAPGSPSLYAMSARDYDGLVPLVGGFLIERGGVPRWRTVFNPATDQRVGMFVVSVIWNSDTASSLTVTVDAATPTSTTITENGVFHIWPGALAPGTEILTMEGAGYGSSDTLAPLVAKIELCTCPLIFLIWRNSVGGYSCWAFENTEGQRNIGQRGDLYASANADGQGYVTSYQTISNQRQGTIGNYRAPVSGAALEITLKDGALTDANVIYLQSILFSQEVFWAQFSTDLYTAMFTPVTITAGDAPLRKRANNLYDFTATLNAPLR